MEKAHPQVFNAFLQILDEGRLTDGRGRTVNFKNTILIMTSNIGSELFQSGKETETRNNKILERVGAFFRPELINRLDSIIIFHSLNKEMMKQIIRIQESHLKERFHKQGLALTLSENMENYLLSVGFDPIYGARPLKRVINESIVDEIALRIVEGKIKLGDKIIIDHKQNKVQISIKKPN